MGSGLLKCFDDGISNNIDPGKPESRSMYEAQAAGKEVKKLPLSLGQALDRLAEDEVIKSAMPDEMYKVFHWYKNDCLLYTSPSPRDATLSRMPSSA